MELALASGPTGGHLLPAILTARQFQHYGINTCLFSSAPASHPLLNNYEGEYSRLRIKNWPAVDLLAKIQGLQELSHHFFRLRKQIREYDALLAFGGYSSVPVIASALYARKPIYLQEQNRIPGKTTLLFSNFARSVFYGLPPLKRGGEQRWYLTGNPTRPVKTISDSWFGDNHLLVVLGGSQGSLELSEHLSKTGGELLEEGWKIYYVAGKFGRDLRGRFEDYDNFRQVEFTNQLPEIMSCATCVWSRAGAGTVSELAVYNVPALLFPFKAAADSHQHYNAGWLAGIGPARVIKKGEDNKLVELTKRLSEAKSGYDLPAEMETEAAGKIVTTMIDDLSLEKTDEVVNNE